MRAGSEIFTHSAIFYERIKLTLMSALRAVTRRISEPGRRACVYNESDSQGEYSPGRQIRLGLDVAASEFYDEKKDRYIMRTDRKKMTDEEMIELLESWFRASVSFN